MQAQIERKRKVMKTSRKVLLITLAILLFVSSVAANPSQVKQGLQIGESTTLILGRMGVSFGSSYREGTAALARWSKGPIYHSNSLSFRRDMAYVSFTEPDGYRLRAVLGAVYVFYDLTGPEIKAQKKGLISIYYFKHATNTWVRCPTFKVIGAANAVRLACRISEYGLFGLGTRR